MDFSQPLDVSSQFSVHPRVTSGRALLLTGLSGACKSAIAKSLHQYVSSLGLRSYILDGDEIRRSLNVDLGYSGSDQSENLRRIGEVAKILAEAGVIVFCSFIAPFANDRANLRRKFTHGEYMEVYVKCSIKVLEHRDTKGLYKAARLGTLSNLTGVSAPYEESESPEIVAKTDSYTLSEVSNQIILESRRRNFLTDALLSSR